MIDGRTANDPTCFKSNCQHQNTGTQGKSIICISYVRVEFHQHQKNSFLLDFIKRLILLFYRRDINLFIQTNFAAIFHPHILLTASHESFKQNIPVSLKKISQNWMYLTLLILGKFV